ncbi:hypothetical protein LEMLEM_LOCUS19892 [Lemmus lemmus]
MELKSKVKQIKELLLKPETQAMIRKELLEGRVLNVGHMEMQKRGKRRVKSLMERWIKGHMEMQKRGKRRVKSLMERSDQRHGSEQRVRVHHREQIVGTLDFKIEIGSFQCIWNVIL